MAYQEEKGADLTQSHLKEKVALYISCKDLVEKDFNSKSDPFIVVYLRDKKTQKFTELGRTEVITDNSYPSFTTNFKLDYYFEEEQLLRFDVYDEDKKGSKRLKDHDFIGSIPIILGELMHETGQSISKKILSKKGKPIKNKKSKKYSSLTITADKVATGSNSNIKLQFTCNNLPKMDGMFGKADPYFVIKRKSGDNGQEFPVQINERRGKPASDFCIKKTLNPVWPAFTTTAQSLCNCDPYAPIVIEIWDWDSSTADDIIGIYETNLNELSTKPKGLQLTRRSKSKKNKSYGTLNIVQFEQEPIYGFLDYLQGGAEISLMTAIDFTGSNGHPNDVQSLHHLADYYSKGVPSRYQKAIRQIGNIVSVYDFDKKFPVWGFGAWFKSTKIVYHGFALNQLPGFGEMIQKQIDINNPEVLGLYEMELAYLNAVKLCSSPEQTVALSGPTLFEEILEKSRRLSIVAHNADNLQYNILVILTDGIINDMPKTKDKIVEIANANLPLSIIIIGIGNADFSKMDELDGDEGRLKNSKGVYAKRDIVQFVPMKQYEHNMTALSSLTLQEIPRQFLSYVKAHNIKPGKKPSAHNVDFAVNEDIKEQEQELNEVASDYNPSQDPYSNAPLPHGWERAYADNGRPYYVNNNDQTTQWLHPNDPSAAK